MRSLESPSSSWRICNAPCITFLLMAAGASAQSTLHTVTEPDPGAEAGRSVALWEDVDGDGRVEWVVGSPGKDTTAPGAGRITVFSGATGQSLFNRNGTGADDAFGDALANVGDLDGDGHEDLAIGASGARAVSVLSGSTQAPLWSHAEPGRAGFGASVARAGDVNGDGTGDVIVGAPLSDTIVVLSGIDGSVLFASTMSALTRFGFSVASAGDIDGDGFDDVLAGAPFTNNGQFNEGAVVVLLGPLGAVAYTHRPSGINDRGQEFGFSVAPTGDIDGDGFDDYAVGARYYGGLHFVDYNFVAVFSGASHAELRHFEGPYDQWFGQSLANVGDIDLDGHDDLAIGNPLGQEIVVYSPVRDIAIERFSGPGFEFAGDSVAGGRDVDGDGFADMVHGSPIVSPFGAIGPGRATVFTVGCPSDPVYNFCDAAPNSASQTGARISKQGTTSLSGPGLRLVATDCPTNTFALFFHGTEEARVPSGFGQVCIGGTLLRLFPAVATGPGGAPSLGLDLAALGVAPGDTRFFQCWVRDNAGGVAGHNFSDGLRVTFCP